MAFLRTRTAFRRFALTLATAQLVAYAATPVVEAMTERAPGPVSIEAAHGTACVTVHQPATCLACQLLTLHARRAEATPIACGGAERAAPIDLTLSAAAPRAPPRRFLTRAPPIALA